MASIQAQHAVSAKAPSSSRWPGCRAPAARRQISSDAKIAAASAWLQKAISGEMPASLEKPSTWQGCR
jgi:hypothetical protein